MFYELNNTNNNDYENMVNRGAYSVHQIYISTCWCSNKPSSSVDQNMLNDNINVCLGTEKKNYYNDKYLALPS